MNSDQNSGPLKKSTDRRLVVLVVVLMLIIGILLGWVLGSGSYKSDDHSMNATEDSGLVEQTGQSTTTTQAPATTTAPPPTTTQAPATTTAPSPTTTHRLLLIPLLVKMSNARRSWGMRLGTTRSLRL